jgi:hypothetical protein
MTKAAAAPSANAVPQSPSLSLLPSVQILFDCFCGRGAWILARRFDKPRVGHDKSRCRHQCESSAAVPFVSFATFCSNPLRLLLWARRLRFWRDDSINRGLGMTKAAAAPSANPVSSQSPSFPLLPSVQNLFGYFCGRGVWLLAWRFDKPSVGHDKSRCYHQCESSK